MVEEMIKYVQNFFKEHDEFATQLTTRFPFRNRFEHSMRVYQWAKRISEVEKGDQEIVEISAIFHDIGKAVPGDIPHAETGAELCRHYLESIYFDKVKTDRIVQAIQHHSSKGASDLVLTKEDQIIMDADSLDEVGALTVLWDSLGSGQEEKPEYMKVYLKTTGNLAEIKKGNDYLKTVEGKRLYQERVRFLEYFLDNLRFELGLDDCGVMVRGKWLSRDHCNQILQELKDKNS